MRPKNWLNVLTSSALSVEPMKVNRLIRRKLTSDMAGEELVFILLDLI